MAEKICGLGFDCASMMLCVGIDPGDCENYQTCGSAKKLSPEEEFELRVAREQNIFGLNREIIYQTITINRHQAAIMMLMQRGNPQTAESLGVLEAIAAVETKIQELNEGLV